MIRGFPGAEIGGQEKAEGQKKAETTETNPHPLPFLGAIPAEGEPRHWGCIMESSPETKSEPTESETYEKLWSKNKSPKDHQSEGARSSSGSWDEAGI